MVAALPEAARQKYILAWDENIALGPIWIAEGAHQGFDVNPGLYVIGLKEAGREGVQKVVKDLLRKKP